MFELRCALEPTAEEEAAACKADTKIRDVLACMVQAGKGGE